MTREEIAQKMKQRHRLTPYPPEKVHHVRRRFVDEDIALQTLAREEGIAASTLGKILRYKSPYDYEVE